MHTSSFAIETELRRRHDPLPASHTAPDWNLTARTPLHTELDLDWLDDHLKLRPPPSLPSPRRRDGRMILTRPTFTPMLTAADSDTDGAAARARARTWQAMSAIATRPRIRGRLLEVDRRRQSHDRGHRSGARRFGRTRWKSQAAPRVRLLRIARTRCFHDSTGMAASALDDTCDGAPVSCRRDHTSRTMTRHRSQVNRAFTMLRHPLQRTSAAPAQRYRD